MEIIEIQEKMIPHGNYRLENIKKATEARVRKAKERRELKAKKLSLISVDSINAEKFLNDSIQKFGEDSNIGSLKNSFYTVFNEIGGVDGMVKWVKKDQKNRMEYYKLFIGLLKAESTKQPEGQKQQVVVNIISPDQKKEIIIDGRTE